MNQIIEHAREGEFIPRIPYRAAPKSLMRIFLCHITALAGLVAIMSIAAERLSGRGHDAVVIIVLLIFLVVGFRLAYALVVTDEQNTRIRFAEVSERYHIMYYAPEWDKKLSAEYHALHYKMWRNGWLKRN